MNTYQPGNLVKMTVSFTDASVPPVPSDPTEVTLRVSDPNDVETDYLLSLGQVTKVSTGNYSLVLQVDTSGYWKYRWEGTGAIVAATETRFLVSQSNFSNPL